VQKIKLPEKEWFTFAEVAERWQVDVETVAHYVWDLHLLRPAFVKKDIRFRDVKMFFCPDHQKGDEDIDSYALTYRYEYTNKKEFKENFLYLNADYMHSEDDPVEISTGFRYQIKMLPDSSDSSGEGMGFFAYFGGCLFADFKGEAVNLSVGISLDGISPKEKCIPMIPVCNNYFITKEERDRFELLYSENEIKTTGKTQEENTLYAVGVMAMLLAEKSSGLKISNRPNAEQIAKAVNAAADRYGLSDSGLKSLHKKIAEGLRLVNKIGA